MAPYVTCWSRTENQSQVSVNITIMLIAITICYMQHFNCNRNVHVTSYIDSIIYIGSILNNYTNKLRS